jgi:tRNA/tmRNA/rRNA uracil-C5-methylase (TrmA/RlmC/RlmD family)
MEQLASVALACAGVVGFHWLRNATLTDISFGAPVAHWGVAELAMRAGRASLTVGPNTFFQNNVHLLERLLDDVRDAATAPPGLADETVADLYGGVGTIALQLAPLAGSVVCVESVGESAALAERNAAANGAPNVRAVALDVLPFLREQAAGAFSVAVADPPRLGLGPEVCAELLRVAPRRIVYVSCNPLTQIEDLRVLRASYSLRELRGYDMFPHTPHVETVAILDRAGIGS